MDTWLHMDEVDTWLAAAGIVVPAATSGGAGRVVSRPGEASAHGKRSGVGHVGPRAAAAAASATAAASSSSSAAAAGADALLAAVRKGTVKRERDIEVARADAGGGREGEDEDSRSSAFRRPEAGQGKAGAKTVKRFKKGGKG